jgi:probable phosphoglycerate mutase
VTRLFLIRHAHHVLVGKALAGRSDVALSEEGRDQAHALAQRLAKTGIDALYTSPQRRARETAAPLAAKLGLEPKVDGALDEIDFGEWTGKRFDELEREPHWRVWCERRSVAQPPAGERFVDVERRVADALKRYSCVHPDARVALISHGDVIKAALAHVMRSSLDELERFDVAPAAVCIIAAQPDWQRVELVNATEAL